MKKKDEIIDFCEDILKSVSKYRSLLVSKDFEYAIFEYIINVTSKFYSIDSFLILKSKKRGEIAESRKMCIALMKEHLHLSDQGIGKYLGGRSRQFINREFITSPLNQEQLATKQEVKFVENFLILTKDVENFKKSFNMENKTILDE